MAHIGHPLIGDPLYGKTRTAPKARSEAQAKALEYIAKFPRQALHAGLLGFHHPVTQDALRFESALPPDLVRLLAELWDLSRDCEGA